MSRSDVAVGTDMMCSRMCTLWNKQQSRKINKRKEITQRKKDQVIWTCEGRDADRGEIKRKPCLIGTIATKPRGHSHESNAAGTVEAMTPDHAGERRNGKISGIGVCSTDGLVKEVYVARPGKSHNTDANRVVSVICTE